MACINLSATSFAPIPTLRIDVQKFLFGWLGCSFDLLAGGTMNMVT
jgi:hypothetical protein